MPKTKRKPIQTPDVSATIERLIPHNLPFIEVFWISALQTCIAQPEMLAEFRATTGRHWTPGRTPLDRMIDQATGIEAAFLVAFIEWFHTNVWGDDAALAQED